MKKILLGILLFGSVLMATPANWIIYDREYKTFAAASADIRAYGTKHDWIQYTSYMDKVTVTDYYDFGYRIDLYINRTVIRIYGNDKIESIRKKLENGQTVFTFPKVIYDDYDSLNSGGFAVFIYYQ